MAVLVLRLPSVVETLILGVHFLDPPSFGSSNVPAENPYLLGARLPLKNWTRYGWKPQRMMIKYVRTLTTEPKNWQKTATNKYGCSRLYVVFRIIVYCTSNKCVILFMYNNHLNTYYVFGLRIDLNEGYN